MFCFDIMFEISFCELGLAEVGPQPLIFFRKWVDFGHGILKSDLVVLIFLEKQFVFDLEILSFGQFKSIQAQFVFQFRQISL